LGFGDAFVPGFLRGAGADGVVFFLDARYGVKQELREVADGESVAAVDAAAGELLGDVGEKRVDAVGGVEIAGSIEEFGGDDFGIGLGGLRLAKVIGTERFAVDAKHVAMVAAGRDVLALARGDEFGGSFRRVK
jgi:hypothetical protein